MPCFGTVVEGQVVGLLGALWNRHQLLSFENLEARQALYVSISLFALMALLVMTVMALNRYEAKDPKV